MKLTILGSGDAFGTGGRLQKSLHLSASDQNILVDCGATTLIAMAQAELDPNAISAVVLTHLHGDHFSGLVWFLLHAKHVAKRSEPLTIFGPAGTRERLATAAEALFPGASYPPSHFDLDFVEIAEATTLDVAGFTISAFRVRHACGAPPYALRIERGGNVIAFSGDTEWTDNLFKASFDADVFVCECFGYEGSKPGHMTWETLRTKLPQLTAKQILLTHMGPEMLAKRDTVNEPRVGFAEDGLEIKFAT